MKSISALFRGITSNNNGDYWRLNCFYSYHTKNILKKHERLCGKNDYCYLKTPRKDNKILKSNHGEKSLKNPFEVIADFECILQKASSCQNNPEKSYTEKKKLSMSLQVTYGLYAVHLINQKLKKVTKRKRLYENVL